MHIRTHIALLKQALREPVVNPLIVEIENYRLRKTSVTKELRSAQQNYFEAAAQDPIGAAKFCDFEYWRRLNILRAARLGLHRSSSLKILDIGCGPGYFLEACRHFGHEVVGADLPVEEMISVDATIYGSLTSALACRQNILPRKVTAFTKLDIDGSFDVITAFMICFNNHAKPNVWGVDEWRFFLDDASSHLNPDGRLFLQLNEDLRSYPDLLYYNAEQLNLFRALGSVCRDEILIRA